MRYTARTDVGSGRERLSKSKDFDEDDTLIQEVGEHQDFELDDDVDPVDRRRDPLRQPH